MNIAHLFIRAGRGQAERPAIARGTEALVTWGELVRRAAVMAGRLRDVHGLQPGDRVGLVMTNCPEYVELLLAGWYAGLTLVPVNARLHPRELAYILDHAGARLCFATPDLIDAVGPIETAGRALERVIEVGGQDDRALRRGGDPAALTEVEPDALAWLFYTSGTTGRPKGVMLTHRNLAGDDARLLHRCRPVAPGDAIAARRADVARLGTLHPATRRARRAAQVVPAVGRLRSGRDARALRAPSAACSCSPRRRWCSAWPSAPRASGAPATA